jgi:hypothetical protein
MIALLVGLGCFLTHAAISLVWLRLPGRLSPVSRHAVSAIATHILGTASAAWIVGPFAYWPAAAVAGFGAVCWLFTFSAVYKSVSLRILTQLARTPGHSLPLEAITDQYVQPEFETGTLVLVTMGCAENIEGEFALTQKGKTTAQRIQAAQRVCGIEESGMYGN